MQAIQEKIKSPLHLRLTNEQWTKETKGLTGAEIRVLYYIKTLDPFGDRKLDLQVTGIAKALECAKGTVSKALKKLDALELIELSFERVGVKITSSGKGFLEENEFPTGNQMNQLETDCFLEETEVSNWKPNEPVGNTDIYIDRAHENTLSDSSKLNLKTTTDKKIVAVELKKVDPEQEPEGSYQEDKEIAIELRRLNININPTIKKIIVSHRPNVANAIAHLKERIFSGESFKNLEGAFVTACQEGAKPEKLVNPPIELPQPNESQLQELKTAKIDGRIRSYDSYPYNGGRTVLVDDCALRCVIPWWEYLGIDGYEEFEEVEF